ncbi:MAG: flagellar hook assembly protein FlgD [Pseudomonadota bacterium]
MTVASVQSSTGVASQMESAYGGVQEIQERFLSLLVTQLKNQDPMNPMENAELTSQLAQMSTVEGVNNLNTTMNELLNGFYATQNLQAASLIGHQVLADGDLIGLYEGQAGGGVNLEKSADAVVVTIEDAAGEVVKTIDLGPQSAGITHFVWDGTDDAGNALPEGDYRMNVLASQAGGTVPATTLSLSTVTSLTMNSGVFKADLAGLGQYDLNSLRQIF